MDRLPPRIFRRLVLAPLGLAIALSFLAISPALFILAVISDWVIPSSIGSWRATRILSFLVMWFALEAVGIISMFVLWVASGFGLRIKRPPWQEIHYSFMRWWLNTLDGVSKRLFGIKIHIQDQPEPRDGPILVFCRHAGIGNSLMLIGTILVGFQRKPRIVMLAKLQWEPAFDIMLNRVPNRFIRHDPKRREVYINAIGELAASLDEKGAFVLFPEGKDFTPKVRMRALDYLRKKGHDEAAERAERMTHMLPPRHNGVMAAIRGAPGADIVFVAHSVLEDIGTAKDLWTRIPMRYPIHAKYWRIPPSEVPQGKDELIDWLYGWWEQIDGWIEDRFRKSAEEAGLSLEDLGA
jgi:hypothetical protein